MRKSGPDLKQWQRDGLDTYVKQVDYFIVGPARFAEDNEMTVKDRTLWSITLER